MRFTKMHGLGNDFIVFENLNNENLEWNDLAIKVCDRHTGIGADGILLVEKSPTADIKMTIINSDGSLAEMCGNGLRCFSKYVYEKGIVKKDKISVETGAGVLEVKLKIDDNEVKSIMINMGKPILDETKKNYKLKVLDKEYDATTMIMGVPHTIIYVDNIVREELLKYGPLIEKMDIFKNGTNVNFVKVIDKDTIEIRTWERGAGHTLACGTGTCASVVATFINGLTSNKVTAKLALGELKINYDEYVFMEGPAEFICRGEMLK